MKSPNGLADSIVPRTEPRIEHSVSPEFAPAKITASSGKWLFFAYGLVVGGIATYLLDPKDGAQRRASLKDGTMKYGGKFGQTIGSTAADLAEQARSLIGSRTDSAAKMETPEVEIH